MITIINEKHSQANDFADALGGYKGTLPADSTFGSEPYEIVYASGQRIFLTYITVISIKKMYIFISY